MLPVLEEFGVTVLEQPLPPDELDGLGEITAARRHPGHRGRELRDRGRHPAAGGQGGRDQHQARQVRQPAGGAPDDRDRPGARDDGDGGLHDRELASGSPRPPTSRRWWTSWISTAPRCWPTIPSSAPRIDGGQVTLPAGPGPRRPAEMTDALRPRRPAAPARLLVHLPHSRDAGRPGRPGRPRRRARAPARADRHRARRPTRPRPRPPPATSSPRPTIEPAVPAACSPRRGGWRSTTARRSASRSRACCPAGLWGESQVIAVRAPGRWKIGGVAGEVLADGSTSEAGRRRVPRSRGRSSGRVWDAVDRLVRVGAVSLRVEPPDTAGSHGHRARGRPCTGTRRRCSSATHALQAPRAAARALRGARIARWRAPRSAT